MNTYKMNCQLCKYVYKIKIAYREKNYSVLSYQNKFSTIICSTTMLNPVSKHLYINHIITHPGEALITKGLPFIPWPLVQGIVRVRVRVTVEVRVGVGFNIMSICHRSKCHTFMPWLRQHHNQKRLCGWYHQAQSPLSNILIQWDPSKFTTSNIVTICFHWPSWFYSINL